MKSSVNFRCQHILSRVSMIPIVSASALVSQCLLALPNISSIMLGVFFSALSFGGFLTLFLPVLNEMYALLPLGKSSTTLPSGALTPAGTADVSLVSYAACSLSARPSPPFASRSSSCPAYTKPRQHGTAPSLASGPTATRLILALSRRHLVKSWSDSEIRLVVSPLEADISESESPAASARSKRGTRPGRPLEAGGARSKLGAPARSGRLPASVLRPSAALNAVAGRGADPRPLLGAPAPRCRHTEALWPPPHWQCARKAAPLSANVRRRRRR